MPKIEAYIESATNPRVKSWAKLTERKYREREGKFLLEGVHLVEEALAAGWPLAHVVYDAGADLPDTLTRWRDGSEAAGDGAMTEVHPDRDPNVGIAEPGRESAAQPTWIPASPEVIAKCSSTEMPQPVFAVARKRPYNVETLLAPSPMSLIVALDGVQDPGNVGTIVRSASACGATAVVLGGGTADLYNAKTLRSTMGALFHIPVLEGDLSQLLPAACASGATIAGTSLQAARSCYDFDFRRPVWLVLGNEGAGVSEQTLALASERLLIPMTGRAESLNVAMAATVLLFEAQRQRHFPETGRGAV